MNRVILFVILTQKQHAVLQMNLIFDYKQTDVNKINIP